MFVLFAFIAVVGYYSWTRLAIDAYPDIADTTVQIVTQVPGLAAEEIEQQITIPIERAVNGLPGLNVMRSKNTFGLSTVVLVFDDGIDDYWARQRVQELKNDGYPDANVFNPQGVGGIHMIYVLPEKPETYGFKPQAATPNSIDVWKDIVRPLGKLAGAGAVVGVLGLAAVKGMMGKKNDDDHGKGEH